MASIEEMRKEIAYIKTRTHLPQSSIDRKVATLQAKIERTQLINKIILFIIFVNRTNDISFGGFPAWIYVASIII